MIVDLDSIVIDGENVVSQIASANNKAGKNFNHEQVGFDRFYDDETMAVNLLLDYLLSENWTITPKVGYSQATGIRDDINPIFSNKVQNLGYSLANGSYMPEIIYPTDAGELTAMNAEHLKLDVRVLGDSFDDQIRILDAHHGLGRRDVTEQFLAVPCPHLLFVDLALQDGANLGDALLRDLGFDVTEGNVDARGRTNLSDTGTHLASAEYGNLLDVT